MTYGLATAAVTLDGSGAGTAQLGPVPPWCTWEVTRISVSGTGALAPTVNIFRGFSPNPAHFVDGTNSGNRDSSDTAVTMQQGDTLLVAWSDGSPGAPCAIRLEGTQSRQ